MDKIKSILYDWFKNKNLTNEKAKNMKTIIIILLFPCLLFSQAETQAKIFSDKEIQPNVVAIATHFSTPNITAFEQKSSYKLNDLYDYFTLYSSAKNDSLKQQIKENISLQFKKNESIEIWYKNEKITLEKFLQQIENKEITFEISNEKTVLLYTNFWLTSYTITLRKPEKPSENYNVKQKIYLLNENKNFGETTKKTWNLYLGEMESN